MMLSYSKSSLTNDKYENLKVCLHFLSLRKTPKNIGIIFLGGDDYYCDK